MSLVSDAVARRPAEPIAVSNKLHCLELISRSPRMSASAGRVGTSRLQGRRQWADEGGSESVGAEEQPSFDRALMSIILVNERSAQAVSNSHPVL